MSDVFYDFRLYIPVDGRNDAEQIQTKLEEFIEDNNYPFELEPIRKANKDVLSIELVSWDTCEDIDPLLEDLYEFVLNSFNIRIEGTAIYDSEGSVWVGSFNNACELDWFEIAEFYNYTTDVLKFLQAQAVEFTAPALKYNCPNCKKETGILRVFNGIAVEQVIVEPCGQLTTDRNNLELSAGSVEYRCDECKSVVAYTLDELGSLIGNNKELSDG